MPRARTQRATRCASLSSHCMSRAQPSPSIFTKASSSRSRCAWHLACRTSGIVEYGNQWSFTKMHWGHSNTPPRFLCAVGGLSVHSFGGCRAGGGRLPALASGRQKDRSCVAVSPVRQARTGWLRQCQGQCPDPPERRLPADRDDEALLRAHGSRDRRGWTDQNAAVAESFRHLPRSASQID